MEALVSAIITTYKRKPDVVLRAASSVLRQTYHNIELIVVDDSPVEYEKRDEVREAISKLDGRVTYIQHEKNMGACVARNTGLAASQGQFVGFLDDDDEWMPEKIERQINAFTEEEIALVYCGNRLRNEMTAQEYEPKRKWYSGMVYDQLILENFIGSTSFPLIRKSCLDEIGGFDPLMKSAQDYDVWLRLSEKYRISYTKEPLVLYSVHGGERISSNFKSRIAGQERLHEKNREYLAQNKHAWWFRHIKLSAEYANDLQIKNAIGLWMRAVCKCPGQVKLNIKYLMKIVVNGLVHMTK